MKRILLILLLVATTACTPAQVAWHIMMQDKVNAEADPVIKAELQAEYQFWSDSYEAAKTQATAGHPCAEWYDHAIQAGFTPSQWQEPVSRIMFRESRCNPMADNPNSSARGLMQHLSWWAPICGGTYEDLHNPEFSLRCAYTTYLIQGWGAWSTY